MPIRIRATLAVLLALLTIIVIGPFLVPVRELEATVPAKQLADDDSRFTDVAGVDVHYKELGEGETAFVLLHGFASSTFTWRELMQPLAELGRVLAFDQVGFGLSERVLDWSGTNPYRAEAQVEQTLALMDRRGIERATLVGHSAGARLALDVALAAPERLDSLVLIAPAVSSSGGAPAWARPFLNSPQMNRLGPLVMRQLGETPGEQLLRNAWSDESRISDEAVEGYSKPLKVENWDRALWEYTKANRPPSYGRDLESLTLPVLIVSGGDDRIVPVEVGERLSELLPLATFIRIDSCGHVVQEECPEQVTAALRDWLEGLESPR